mmetsp:Transcript_1851/g.2661  ORF Transcript_1851/g.2661 Transcript_1851/m.2661 type:complete len:428 (-) Transcript_1851:51-1334(-)
MSVSFSHIKEGTSSTKDLTKCTDKIESNCGIPPDKHFVGQIYANLTKSIYQVVFSPNSGQFAVCGDPKEVRLFSMSDCLADATGDEEEMDSISSQADLARRKTKTSFPWVGFGSAENTSRVVAVDWSKDGRWIATASNCGNWSVYKADTLELHRKGKWPDSGEMKGISFSADSRRVVVTGASGKIGTVDFINPSSTIQLYTRHPSTSYAAYLSPCGKLLLSCSWQKQVRINLDTSSYVSLPGHTTNVWDCDWHPSDPDQFLSVSSGTHILHWTIIDRQALFERARGPDTARTLSETEVNSGSLIKRVKATQPNAGTGSYYGIQFSPNGKYYVACGQSGACRIFDAQTDSLCWALSVHSSSVWRSVWSPNGKYLASCSMDNTVVIWRAPFYFTKLNTLKLLCLDVIEKNPTHHSKELKEMYPEYFFFE